jgi:hypothetical protein
MPPNIGAQPGTAGIQIRIHLRVNPGNTAPPAGGFQEYVRGRDGSHAVDFWVKRLGQLGHEHDVALPPHGRRQGFILSSILWQIEENVEDHERRTVVGETIEELSVARTRERAALDAERAISIIVQRHEHD